MKNLFFFTWYFIFRIFSNSIFICSQYAKYHISMCGTILGIDSVSICRSWLLDVILLLICLSYIPHFGKCNLVMKSCATDASFHLLLSCALTLTERKDRAATDAASREVIPLLSLGISVKLPLRIQWCLTVWLCGTASLCMTDWAISLTQSQ